MYCGKCGFFIKEGNAFCTNCGAPVGDSVVTPSFISAPCEYAADSRYTDTNKLLIWGILSLILAFVPPISWVILIIARHKVKVYRAAGGVPCRDAELAANLTKFALVFTILMTVVAVIGLIIAAVLITFRMLTSSLLKTLIDGIVSLFAG